MNFGFGKKQAPPEPTGPDPMFLAKTEMKMYTDLFNRLSDVCFRKCMAGMKETELNVGELSCVDRCVAKYMETHNIVGKKIQQAEQQMISQMQQR